MKRELLQEYSMRVSQASASGLVVILYDIILEDIKSAKEALEAGDTALYEHELKHAGRFLNELMGTLDYSVPLSYRLMSLYIFANRQLITAAREKDTAALDGTAEVLSILKDGFAEVSRQDESGPVMQNTQQVYAGLTYGRGTLNETYLDPGQQSRGFKA